MIISNPQLPNQIIEANGLVLKVKVIGLGNWNMDTGAAVTKAHDLTFDKIIGCQSWIINDAGNARYSIAHAGATNAVAGHISINATQVIISRFNGGFFDNANYSSLLIARGYIFLWYID